MKKAEAPKFTLYGDFSKNFKKVEVEYYSTKAEAEARRKKLKTWKYSEITKARDESGKWIHGWALILCK